ncbi:MAG: hypothetical protein AAF443_00745 [Chlamydiota bacterium]
MIIRHNLGQEVKKGILPGFAIAAVVTGVGIAVVSAGAAGTEALARISHKALEKFGASVSPEYSNLFPWKRFKNLPLRK